MLCYTKGRKKDITMTLKQLSDTLGVHPADLTGDAEFAEEMMNEDITDTIFYKGLKELGAI